MNTNIQKIIDLVNPRVLNIFIDWESIESKIGNLPSDYKEIKEVLGNFSIGESLSACTELEDYSGIIRINLNVREIYKEKKKIYPEIFVLDPDSIYVLAVDDNSNYISWICNEENAGHIVFIYDEFLDFIVFEMEFSAFIFGLLNKDIKINFYEDLYFYQAEIDLS